MSSLDYGRYYHIYNRGNDKTDIFQSKEDYLHFQTLVQKYLLTVADLFCYAYLKNHFHFLVRIKESDEIEYFKPIKGQKHIQKKPVPYRQFSHLFNAYAKWFNLKYDRTGSLFEKNFERKEVVEENYLKHLVYYIHHNPIHHHFTHSFSGYSWTSYNAYLENKQTFLKKEIVIDWFDDLENFIFFHQEEHDLSVIEDFI
jgi:REP element-mobilizing transposase RayT